MTKVAKSIVVLVSGNGSNLQAILDHFQHKSDIGSVKAVIANEADAYGLIRAEKAGIESICISHRDYPSRDSYDEALAEQIDQFQPDLVVLAGFMRILTEKFVHKFQGKMLNIHPSLLPKYKGLHTHQKAIDAGDEEHGMSVHFVTPDLDGGPIIIQAKVPIFKGDDATELAQRVQEQERSIYPLVVEWFCLERLEMVNNKAVLDGKVLPETGYAAD